MTKRKRRSGKKGQAKSFINFGMFSKPLANMGYGFVRDKISDAVKRSELGQRLPVTEFTDEAVMLITAKLGRMAGLSRHAIGGHVIRAVEAQEWGNVGRIVSDIQQRRAGTPIMGLNQQQQIESF